MSLPNLSDTRPPPPRGLAGPASSVHGNAGSARSVFHRSCELEGASHQKSVGFLFPSMAEAIQSNIPQEQEGAQTGLYKGLSPGGRESAGAERELGPRFSGVTLGEGTSLSRAGV